MGGLGFGIAIIVIFISLMAVFIALAVVMGNMKKARNEPLLTKKAVFLGTRTQSDLKNQNFASSAVDGPNAYEMRSYFLDFMIEKKEKKTFRVKKKVALGFSDGDEGSLTFKGNTFIDFKVKKKQATPPLAFMTTKGSKTWKLKAQIDALSYTNLNVVVSVEDALAFIASIETLKNNDFFSIEKANNDFLQVEANPNDYLVTIRTGSHETQGTHPFSELKEVTTRFLNS